MARQYGAPRDEDMFNPQKARKDRAPEPKDPDPSPSSIIVQQFHKNAAVDTRPEDIHHTLGPEPNQASPGPHSHNGGDSVLLLEGYTLTGSKSNPSSVLPSIIAGLVRLGMTDSTTA